MWQVQWIEDHGTWQEENKSLWDNDVDFIFGFKKILKIKKMLVM